LPVSQKVQLADSQVFLIDSVMVPMFGSQSVTSWYPTFFPNFVL